MLLIDDKKIRVQSLSAPWLDKHKVQLDVLRLDEIHPVVSGNKWFKLQYYLQETVEQQYNTVATCGGAYSNHIVATAYACNAIGVESVGIIRGAQPKKFSHTLLQAQAYGMQLHFVSREQYRQKENLKALYPNAYWINEGGYGKSGVAGAAIMLQQVPQLEQYTHITCAVGTGTTLAGVIAGALPGQQVIGISALKGYTSLHEEVRSLLPASLQHSTFTVVPDFHFGGYAKYNAALLKYMNDIFKEHQLPLDFVYTAKAFFATEAAIRQEIIPQDSRVLMLHTGGLQGNLSLPAGTLAF